MDATNEIGNLTNVHNQMRFIVRVHGAHAIFCCFAGMSERDREMKKDVNGSWRSFGYSCLLFAKSFHVHKI